MLKENKDYIINSEGNLVFTKEYLLARGHCCKSGCANCPYGYLNNIDPNIPAEYSSGWSTNAEDFLDEEENGDGDN